MSYSHLVKSLRVFAVTTLTLTSLAFSSASPAGAAVSVDTQVSIGSQHVVALGSNGTVWTWGSLVPGPTGVGSKYALSSPTGVTLPGGRTAVDVAATYSASFAAASDGTVWAWGSLGRGLGDASVTTDSAYTSPVQVAIPGGASIVELSAACEGIMARSSAGDVYQWGSFYGNWNMSYATPTRLTGVSGATGISRGCNSSFAIAANGSAFAWGSNGGGRLGDGTTTDRPSPVTISLPGGRSFKRIAASSSHTVGIATDGSVFAWGGNSQGQLGADPNALSYSSTPRAVAIGGATAIALSVSDSTPFTTVVTSANTALKWGGWGSSDYQVTSVSLPTTDLGSRVLKDVTTLQNVALFVADDNSIWGKGWWGSVDVDGNCGATASDYPMWKDGVTYAARPLVRTISQGQFGPSFTEDLISLGKLESGSGTALPLDGSGTAIGSVGTELTITATAPQSSCYKVDQLGYEFSDDNGGTWSNPAVTNTTNSVAQTVISFTYTPASSGRKRAQFKIKNPDGKFVVYKFTIGVAAANGGGGAVTPSVLPTVVTAGNTALAIGTDKKIYGWGENTAITGASDTVKDPVQVVPAVDTNQTFRSIALASRGTSSAVAAAVSEDGKLYVWGTGTADQVLGGASDIGSPTQLAMPAGKKALKVYLISANTNLTDTLGSSNTSAIVGLVVDESGAVYVWGGGTSLSTSVSQSLFGRFGATVIAAPNLTGLSFASAIPTATYGSVFLRQSGGDVYYWNMSRIGPCSPNCSWRSPVLVGSFTSKFTFGMLSSSQTSVSGIFEVTGSGGLKFTPFDPYTGTSGTPSALTLPGGRTSADIAKQGGTSDWSGPRVLASDGTVWNYQSTEWPAWKMSLPVDSLPISRFASSDGRFAIGAAGALWSLARTLPGTCAVPTFGEGEYGYGSQDVNRVTSIGQFGPTFKTDVFKASVDSPNNIYIDDKYASDHIGRPSITGEYNQPVDVRPGSSVRLYTYFQSACDGTTGLSVAWDLDDDGVYETSSTVSAVTHGETMLTTPIISSTGETTWAGITEPDFKESHVDITDASLGGALNKGGGRFVSVRYTSSYGSSTQRYAVVVRPKKPAGRVGVTINSGSRFTDSSEVTISMVWPEGSTSALISNDGSFSDAQMIPVASSLRWRLPSEGSGLLPTTVYVRFNYLWADWVGGWSPSEGEFNYTDDIVLDLSPPEVTSVSASSQSQSSTASVRTQRVVDVIRMMAAQQSAVVSMSATDAASGIAAVQVTSDPAVPGPERAFARTYTVPVERGTIAVRAKDNVGHWSDWSYTKITGYGSNAEPPSAPQQPSPPQQPSVPQQPSAQQPTMQVPDAPASASPTGSAPVASAPSSAGSSVSLPVVASAKATLSGATAKVTVTVPSSLSKTCSTTVVKGKKVSTCKASTISVSVSGGTSKTLSAKSGNNAISLTKAKRGATVTVKLNGKVIQRIKL